MDAFPEDFAFDQTSYPHVEESGDFMSEETDEEIELRVFDGTDSNSNATIADMERAGPLRIQLDSPFDLPLQEEAMELALGCCWDVSRGAYLSRILEAPVDGPEESMVEC
ncbi:hypothetical protein MMYC01_202116 [Madurella mycetomatis]|uniref:Uncharacterized protein n=1 Tax=Madurella mycetomatis TaxID=100816 RepID=A0A175WBR6_9PEZI|nr:hypothetical protein MMYC01_202116 [Madurella mycetomatis]